MKVSKFSKVSRWGALGFYFVLATVLIQGTVHAGEPYDWPLDEPTYLTSSFAEYRGSHLHNGIDFSTGRGIGSDVRAVDDGRLSRVFFDPDLYGKTIILEHDDGRRTWYSHLDRLDSSVRSSIGGPIEPGGDRQFDRGKHFSRGERIAYSGRTGRGPAHLHLAIQDAGGSFLNPIGRFNPRLPFEPEPNINSLVLHPLSGNTWINSKDETVQINSKSDQVVEVWGDLGVDLTLWNQHEGRGIRSLPTTIRVLRDGELIRELDFDRLSPRDQDTGVHWIFDRQRSNLSPTQFTLHVTPNRSPEWDGLQFTKRGRNGTLQFIAETTDGATQSKTLSYEVVPPPEEIQWDHQQLRPKNRERVESVRDAGSGFRLASLRNGQFAREQYSPPSREGTDDPSLRLETRRGVNRIRVELKIENRWDGWPQVLIRGDGVDTELPLYQVEPGHFVGIWSPELSRDGWFELEASLSSEDDSSTVSRRIYLQSVRSGEPGSALSEDGRFSIFSSGSDLNGEAFVSFDSVPRKPIRSDLEYVESPREVRPRWLQSREPFEVTVDLSDFEDVGQIGLYQWNPARNRWNLVSYGEGLTASSRKAQIFDPGLLGLLRDERSPRVESVVYRPETSSIEVDVIENGSGVDPDQLKVSTDRGEVPAYWDADKSRIVVPDGSILRRNRNLELSVTDRAGNRTEWSGSVTER